MRRLYKTHFFASLLAFSFILVTCQRTSNEKKSFTTMFGPAELREDFQQTIRVLRKNHPALFDFTNEKDFDSYVGLQYSRIVDSLSLNDFFKILAPIVTKVGCAHSYLQFDNQLWDDSVANVLPLKLFFINKRAFVVDNFNHNTELKPGTEILQINGIPIPELIKNLEMYISSDGYNESTKRQALNQGFSDFLAIEQNFPKEYEVAYKRSENDSIKNTIYYATSRKEFWDSNKMKELLSFEINSDHTAIITIRSFAYYDNPTEFYEFVDNSFDKIKATGVDNLILDLRDNLGGDPFCSSYLLSYLAKKPVTYFANSYDNYFELSKPMLLAKNRFKGNLYILTNGLCLSSTGHLCALLKYHNIGMFIGTETGGTYTCNDGSQVFKLVHTGLLLKTARSTFTVDVKGIPRFRGILSDYYADDDIKRLIEGQDAVKEYAFQLIRKDSNRADTHEMIEIGVKQ